MHLQDSIHYKELREILDNVKKQYGFELDPCIDVISIKVEKIYDYGIEYHIIPKYHLVEIVLTKLNLEKPEYHAEIRKLINVECGGI